MSVIKLTSENFENEVLNSEKIILVDFYADWCGPCKMMSPVIDEIAEEKNNIKVCKLNVDDAQDIAVKYNVMSIPTIIILKNGQGIKRFIGVTSKDNILNALD